MTSKHWQYKLFIRYTECENVVIKTNIDIWGYYVIIDYIPIITHWILFMTLTS